MKPFSWAMLSDDRVYRYWLGRRWDHGPCDIWVMLNPSTADATLDDPTIRRCRGFSRDSGAGSLLVVNQYALRATDPAELALHPDPVGPDNDRHLATVAAGAEKHGGRVIVAWGAHPMATARAEEVYRVLQQTVPQVYCLGRSKSGAPRHPLYVKGDTVPVSWHP